VNTPFWRTVFRSKAVWNCAGGVGLYFGDATLRESFGTPPVDATYRALFLALAFVFGLGYWRVGGVPSTNRDIVRMGVLGQAAVFVITLLAVAGGDPPWPWPYLIVGIVDLIFALLFIAFLRHTRS